jgi:triosephosphate isomerase
MNPDRVEEAVELARATASAAATAPTVEVAVCTPFPYLLPVSDALSGVPIGLGAQDCFWEPQGAFTGEVSVAMLAGVGCDRVIVGHSERRHVLGESDDDVRRKLLAVLGRQLQAILCVGETEQQYVDGQTAPAVAHQVEHAVAGLSPDEAGGVVIAYEPVWAIGTGRNADPEHARGVMALVRQLVSDAVPGMRPDQVRVLYGGSVTAANIEGYVALPECDGALVGGASLKAGEFARMIELTAAVCGGVTAGGGDQR